MTKPKPIHGNKVCNCGHKYAIHWEYIALVIGIKHPKGKGCEAWVGTHPPVPCKCKAFKA